MRTLITLVIVVMAFFMMPVNEAQGFAPPAQTKFDDINVSFDVQVANQQNFMVSISMLLENPANGQTITVYCSPQFFMGSLSLSLTNFSGSIWNGGYWSNKTLGELQDLLRINGMNVINVVIDPTGDITAISANINGAIYGSIPDTPIPVPPTNTSVPIPPTNTSIPVIPTLVPSTNTPTDTPTMTNTPTPTPMPAPPVIVVDHFYKFYIHESNSFPVCVTDVNGDEVSLSVDRGELANVSGASPLENTFSWTPHYNGSWAVIFTASDGNQPAVTKTVNVSVVNRPILPTSIPLATDTPLATTPLPTDIPLPTATVTDAPLPTATPRPPMMDLSTVTITNTYFGSGDQYKIIGSFTGGDNPNHFSAQVWAGRDDDYAELMPKKNITLSRNSGQPSDLATVPTSYVGFPFLLKYNVIISETTILPHYTLLVKWEGMPEDLQNEDGWYVIDVGKIRSFGTINLNTPTPTATPTNTPVPPSYLPTITSRDFNAYFGIYQVDWSSKDQPDHWQWFVKKSEDGQNWYYDNSQPNIGSGVAPGDATYGIWDMTKRELGFMYRLGLTARHADKTQASEEVYVSFGRWTGLTELPTPTPTPVVSQVVHTSDWDTMEQLYNYIGDRPAELVDGSLQFTIPRGGAQAFFFNGGETTGPHPVAVVVDVQLSPSSSKDGSIWIAGLDSLSGTTGIGAYYNLTDIPFEDEGYTQISTIITPYSGKVIPLLQVATGIVKDGKIIASNDHRDVQVNFRNLRIIELREEIDTELLTGLNLFGETTLLKVVTEKKSLSINQNKVDSTKQSKVDSIKNFELFESVEVDGPVLLTAMVKSNNANPKSAFSLGAFISDGSIVVYESHDLVAVNKYGQTRMSAVFNLPNGLIAPFLQVTASNGDIDLEIEKFKIYRLGATVPEYLLGDIIDLVEEPTATPTPTATDIPPVPTPTATEVPSEPTDTPTPTITDTPTATVTPTNTSTPTATDIPTDTPTATEIPSEPTDTPTPTDVPIPTLSPTPLSEYYARPWWEDFSEQPTAEDEHGMEYFRESSLNQAFGWTKQWDPRGFATFFASPGEQWVVTEQTTSFDLEVMKYVAVGLLTHNDLEFMTVPLMHVLIEGESLYFTPMASPTELSIPGDYRGHFFTFDFSSVIEYISDNYDLDLESSPKTTKAINYFFRTLDRTKRPILYMDYFALLDQEALNNPELLPGHEDGNVIFPVLNYQAGKISVPDDEVKEHYRTVPESFLDGKLVDLYDYKKSP